MRRAATPSRVNQLPHAVNPADQRISTPATVDRVPRRNSVPAQPNLSYNTRSRAASASRAPLPSSTRSATSIGTRNVARQPPVRPPSLQAQQLQAALDKVCDVEKQLQLEKLSKEKAEKEKEKWQQLAEQRLCRVQELEELVREQHEQISDLKGNVRVLLRFRPLTAVELPSEQLRVDSDTQVTVFVGRDRKTPKQTQFQRVFESSATQADVFQEVSDLISSVIYGFNVAIYAYGQTGSGKTHTMRGNAAEEGIIPRAFAMLFHRKRELADLGWQIDYSASFVEVYKEAVYDLLAVDKVKIPMKDSVRDEFIKIPIAEMRAINEFMRKAEAARTTAATKHNAESSRSHAVCLLTVTAKNVHKNTETKSTLSLVDLAGSERLDTDLPANHKLAEEGKKINLSLLQLKNCLRNLKAKTTHISYRSAVLTHLLRDTLGEGSAKTLIIVTLSQAEQQAEETRRAVEFAEEVSQTHIGRAAVQQKRAAIGTEMTCLAGAHHNTQGLSRKRAASESTFTCSLSGL